MAEENKNSLSEAEKFLESLNLPDAQATETPDANTDPNDIMSFLDEISNYPTNDEPKETTPLPTKEETSNGWKSWGNSFWNQASAAVKTTTDQINRSVANSDTATKLLESRVKALQDLVNKENIEKLGTGLKNLTTTFLETVAPPISEHELVEVYLAYDMVGYTGLEALVYRAFARVMEHTESGQVVVHHPTQQEQQQKERDLCMCDSPLDGTKLAKANIDHLIKQHYDPNKKQSETFHPTTGAVPVIYCPVFMALQSVKLTMPVMDEQDTEQSQLSFVILLVDPTHNLKFKTWSQSMPLSWLDIPYEENEWVEDKMVDILRMAVTTIAQDYVWTRMSGAPSEEAVDV